MKVSLRDYFAANAPETPTWYEPVFEYPRPPKKPDHPTHFSTEEMKKMYFGWLDDPCWDLDEPEFVIITEEWSTYWKNLADYERQKSKDFKVFKFISWRYFYAEKMIECTKNSNNSYPNPILVGFAVFVFLSLAYLLVQYVENSNVRIF